jgi:hypothetical protein
VNKSGLILSNGSTVPVNFSVGSSGADFNISQSGSGITFNLPDASTTARGLITTGSQTIAGAKTLTAVLNWGSGLGEITHLYGPVDQALRIAGGAPTQVDSSLAGQSIIITAAGAVAGSTGVTAAAGGNVTVLAGNAASSGSGSPFPIGIGGSVVIGAGNGANTGSTASSGGSVTIYAGNPGGASATAGSVNVVGAGSNGAPGGVFLFDSGAVNIFTPSNSGGAGNYVGGPITISTGSGSTHTSSSTARTGAAINIITARGNIASAAGGTGGSGGPLSITSGAGGAVTGTSGVITGGVGGSIGLTAGNGGAAVSASGTRIGGLGGTITITAGNGGDGATTNGAGGNVVLAGGSGGVGAGTSAAAGRILLNSKLGNSSDIISLANATTGQSLHIYNIDTSGTSYERLSIGWSGNVCTIATEKGSAGGSDRVLRVQGFEIPVNYTASPNNTVNHVSFQATGASTNVSVSIVPKGSGAFSLVVPDGTTAGGNARGANAVDLRTTSRSAAADVASGSASFLGPSAVRASGNNSACIFGQATGDFSFSAGAEGIASAGYSANLGGRYSEATGLRAMAGGGFNRAQSEDAAAIGGGENTASAAYSSVFGGYRAVADRYGMDARASGRFAAAGDCQAVEFVLRNKTTTDSAVTLFLNGSSARLTIPSGKGLSADVMIKGFKSDGSVGARFRRTVDIKNVGGTTSLEATPETIGTDYNPSLCNLSITADNTNDALEISVTGVLNETWRWIAVVSGAELAYGV